MSTLKLEPFLTRHRTTRRPNVGEWKVVQGIRVTIPLKGFEKVPCFMYEEDYKWRVVVESCGDAFPEFGFTPKQAVRLAVEAIKKVGIRKALSIIADETKKAPKKPKVKP